MYMERRLLFGSGEVEIPSMRSDRVISSLPRYEDDSQFTSSTRPAPARHDGSLKLPCGQSLHCWDLGLQYVDNLPPHLRLHLFASWTCDEIALPVEEVRGEYNISIVQDGPSR